MPEYCKVSFETDGSSATTGPYFLSNALTNDRLSLEDGPKFVVSAPSEKGGTFLGLRMADSSGRVAEMIGFCSTDANPYVVKINVASDGRYNLQFPADRMFVTRNEGGPATVIPTPTPAVTETPSTAIVTTSTPIPTEIATIIPTQLATKAPETPAPTPTPNSLAATVNAGFRDLGIQVEGIGTAQADRFKALEASQRTTSISFPSFDSITTNPSTLTGVGLLATALFTAGILAGRFSKRKP